MSSLGIPNKEIKEYTTDMEEIKDLYVVNRGKIEIDDLLDDYDLQYLEFEMESWGGFGDDNTNRECYSYDFFTDRSPNPNDHSRKRIIDDDLILLFVDLYGV